MLDSNSEYSLGSLAARAGFDGYFDSDSADSAETSPIETRWDERQLTIVTDGTSWDLADDAADRRTVVEALQDRTATQLTVESDSLEYVYDDRTLDLFAAAAQYHDLASNRDGQLAEEVVTDPLTVGTKLRERSGPIVEVGQESGLLAATDGIDSYESLVDPMVGLTIAGYHVKNTLPTGAQLRTTRTLDTQSKVRIYDRPDNIPLYYIDLVDLNLSGDKRRLLVDAYEAIAHGEVSGDKAASEAIEYVTEDTDDPLLASILRKYTTGYGILEEFFSDPEITDVFATAPIDINPLRVTVDGESMETNIHYSPTGVGSLGSRIRRTSGRAFSRAAPTVDATADLNNGVGLRVAGVTDPVSEGVAFAFREKSDDKFTLPALIKNGTMSAQSAAFLSIAMDRNAAALIAGTRGAGKTTLLGTLLYELRPETRTVIIEDTPELPVRPLQEVGRDIQALRTGDEGGLELSPADALHTALRLGDGALVVGEIRGEEAQVLYEAMRVGANANAVLGTIHGNGAEDVYERVVSDLDVPPSSFGATDLVVTMQSYETPDGRKRRLSAIEGVISDGEGNISFESLYTYDGQRASPTGRVQRGESRFLDAITAPTESYADLLTAVDERSDHLKTLAMDGRTSPEEVARAYVQHR
ncbi:type II/IV secretion system ATPase subunit [Haloarcula salinisoli]|uniref:Type II/IV secretion system ATPase subunit n=1 Tax=Haloarcula salinisoli TaxID=2487746 RepID=A0A8J7YGS1_9EURY|nr:type II/IV secretion system ATPase subunit [Halomicroarcula salinisoli]MBX0288075.1 type II/IV secretion system ATPase subunit [Halomicroarcula salinisoli]MBX0305207.1 type II/IV secretion system ATPase subunit [Halomicroarcula salinisoli]